MQDVSAPPHASGAGFPVTVRLASHDVSNNPTPLLITCHFCALGRQAVYFLLHPCKIPGFLPARFSLC
ncbi:hypothetical protein BLIG_01295 [Bifidobacterium longum subsp. infantis CCUG 52486]|uniref:Uncharacterized protein n=1 Tax=Bifidobacterium longum subsp. infantis CCUG 52486 TaxID=537937 RepID=C5EC13_BIFLI|nr:hypothetical protein BLIG_01295 [Bifidobacterium longum subsp. infantis CCUG 52486]